MNFKKLLYCLFLTILSHNSFAQQPSAFKLFFEKVYLHTDRTWYASGDDIWFKAYLVNAQSNYSTSTSNNLYVELVNPSGQIVSREVVRMDNGICAGDFKLGDSIPGGSYRIRAYTNWMRNFGNHFVFEKEVQVKNILGGDKSAAAAAATSFKKSTQTLGNKIQFFPEGGTLVEGVKTVVAFKAEDAAGNGTEAMGSIISSKNDTVAKFTTSHVGMGNFLFKPVAGVTYKALVKYKAGAAVAADFTAVKPDGFVININNDDSAGISVNIFSNAATTALHASGVLTIAGRHAGKVFYEQKVSLKDGNTFVVIPKADVPAGIASITLYDEAMHPYCERLVFIDNNNPVTLAVSTDKTAYAGKDQVTVNIIAADAQQHPVKATLSLAAVDESMDAPAQNIESYLMLQSELKGKIENISTYFDPNNRQRSQQLDLLLLTQGWRSFLWRQLADTNIHISYIPEPGITISGKVKTTFGDKPLPDMNITLMAPGAKGDKLYVTKTNAAGAYFLDGLGLYGNQTVKISSKNDKGKKGGLLTMDTLFNNPLPAYPVDVNTPDTSVLSKSFAVESAKRFANSKNTDWYNVLPGVVVTNERKSVVLRDGNAYMSFGYPVYNFSITKNDYQYQTLQDFLVKKVPGAVYDVEKEGINFIANGKPVRPRIRVAKKEDVFERIDYYTVRMDQINSVSVRHLLGHPTFARSENAVGRQDLGLTNADVFIIDLDLKPGAYNNDLAYINTDISGYYEARIFYAPNYENPPAKSKPDTRTTIYWEPFVTTDENGKATVHFYNADPKTTIRIDVQGISDKGVPLVGRGGYEVK